MYTKRSATQWPEILETPALPEGNDDEISKWWRFPISLCIFAVNLVFLSFGTIVRRFLSFTSGKCSFILRVMSSCSHRKGLLNLVPSFTVSWILSCNWRHRTLSTDRTIFLFHRVTAFYNVPFYVLHREKMAFFTRPNISVPILPPTESIISTIASSSSHAPETTSTCVVTESTVVSEMKSSSSSSSSESAESQRYEYTIETVGVQV